MFKHFLIRGWWLLFVIVVAVATAGWAIDQWAAARHLRENGVDTVATVIGKRIDERQVTTRRTTRTVLDHIVTYRFTGPERGGVAPTIDREHTETAERYGDLHLAEQVKIVINPDNLEEIDFGAGETSGRARMASYITLGLVAFTALGVWSVWGPARRAATLDRIGVETTARIVGKSVSSGYAKLVVEYRAAGGEVVQAEPPPVRSRKLGPLEPGEEVRIVHDPGDPGNVRVVVGRRP